MIGRRMISVCAVAVFGIFLIGQDCVAQQCDPDPCVSIPNAVAGTCTEIGGPCVGPSDFSCSCDLEYTWQPGTHTCESLPSNERIVFVTESTHTGNLGGLAGADAMCQVEANAAGLTGTFMVWLSDSTHSPSTRFSRAGGPFVLVDGTVIATDWSDLTDGDLLAAITLTAGGAVAGFGTWTSTTAEGHPHPLYLNCDQWQSAVGSGVMGCNWDTNYWWTDCDGLQCGREASLYCFEQ